MIVEEIILPNLLKQIDWNERLFDLSETEYGRAKTQVREERYAAQLEFGGHEFHGIKDATAIISQEDHQLRQEKVRCLTILLLRMDADLFRYMSDYYIGFMKNDIVKRAIKCYQQAEAQACSIN